MSIKKAQDNRQANCSCGQLKIIVSGNPKSVIACNCQKCQKRTGSILGVSSYFNQDQVVTITGESKVFKRQSDSGNESESHFCPACGTTVYWYAQLFPHRIGIAVGCFQDSNFPEPQAVVWTKTKHHWLSYPEHIPSSPTQKF